MITNDDAKKQEICVLNTHISGDNSQTIFDFLHQNLPPDGVDIPLADVSPNDAKWDNHRSNSQTVADIFAYNADFKRWAERMNECSTYLLFSSENGSMKLSQSFFCHVRHCPVCQWRKSLYWKAMTHKSLDGLLPLYPSHRFIFLTLTVKNCEVGNLRDTLAMMNKAWARFIERKEFCAVVDGWIRTTEVTRPKVGKGKNKKICPETGNTHAHPHFHVVLMVKSNFFSKNWIKHSRWVELWAESLRVDYKPVVDIRTVRPKASAVADGTYMDGIRHAVAELIKYAVKPEDMIGDGSMAANAWLYEFCKQVFKLRFVASGGLLKSSLKSLDKITDSEMVHINSNDTADDSDKRRLNFSYYPTKRKYIYNPKRNE